MKINDTVHPLQKIWNKQERLGIGLMSGTSGDGIDAALVKISGSGIETKVQQIGFSFLPFQPEIRKGILKLAEGNSGGASDICRMNFLLGELFAEACEKVCSDSTVEIKDIDFVGSHGQTVYHLPEAEAYLGRRVRGTLQIGEAAVIAQRMQCPVVSDFRVRDMAAGGFGAVIMNGIKRGLFSNEAGSGSAPCAAAAAECDLPVKAGLVQSLGVFIDTIVICTCTAMIMLLVPQDQIEGLTGMELLQTAMRYHLGEAGVIFIAVMLFLFSFSTFLGILFYARSNVAYLFGDNWASQTAYKVLALVMLFIGGIAAYTFVWDLGDVGIGLMTVFNTVILYLMGGQALDELKKYEAVRNEQKKKN